MRLLKPASVATCVVAVLVLFGSTVPTARQGLSARRANRAGTPVVRVRPAVREVLWAADGDANYASGPSRALRRALFATLAPSANIVLLPDASLDANPAAKAAFAAAIDIWAHTIASPVTIRVTASFRNLGNPNILGSSGPTLLCGTGNTYYAAALFDKLLGSRQCAAQGGESAEIDADFNNTFTDWDFGTSGVPVPGKINFMTVVLHELGHGLGFLGSMDANSTSGTFLGTYWNPPIVYDRFAVTGAGAALLGFLSPSQTLAGQLVSNDTYFDGTAARGQNGGLRPKLETHHFTDAFGISSLNGFLEGSSYSHVDDVLYSPDQTGTPKPNGLMTWRLQRAEVYTDPGPIVRGMFEDMGWTIARTSPPSCTYTISPSSYSAPSAAAGSSVSVTTATGCAWTAVSQASFISITSAASGTGSGIVTFTVTANPTASPRTGSLVVAGQTFSVNQAPACSVALSPTSLMVASPATTSTVSVTSPSGCAWTAASQSTFLTMTNGASGAGNGAVTFSVAANPTTAARTGSLVIGGRAFTLTQAGIVRPDVDGDGHADLTVFRPSSGEWFVRRSTSNYGYGDYLALQWGLTGDTPVAADFDGDGRLDLTVYRPSTGEWFIRYSTRGYSYQFDTYQWGLSADIPLVADFDGDGRSDLAVYRPSTGEWFIRRSSNNYSYAFLTYQWGLPGDRPIATDFDADGRSDLAVYRPSTGEWFIRFSSSEFAYATSTSLVWGLPDDVPLAADFDGDRKTDLAVFRPADGTWYVRFSAGGYSFADWSSFQWGLPGDIPLAADFDGDRRTDLVVYRPATGEWFVRYSSTGYSYNAYGTYQWGLPGDVPLIPGKR